MKKITSLLIISVFISSLFLIACKKKKIDEEEETEASFDKAAMYSNYADNVILPNLQSCKIALDSFALEYNNFIANKNVTNLAVARQKFIRAYIQFQYIGTFEFGPSENEIVRANFNTFPTDSSDIKLNIATGSYDLNLLSNLDAKGLPAIDFLLYGKNMSDAGIIALFDTDANSANRNTYLNTCLTEMQTKLTNIISAWNNSYKNTFVSSTGSSIGSSIGLLVNQLNYEVDLLKNAKIGIPLGKRTLGVIMPEKCEAYYANIYSVKLAKECLQNIENVYLGRSISGSDGLGLDDYLDALKAQHISSSLNDAIKAQFAITKSKLAAVSEPLSDAVANNFTAVDAAYMEMVKLLVLLKTDMPSAMGIVITYQDGDGD